MSLNWQWSEKMGKAILSNGKEVNLYRGNAFIIAINEWKQNGEELYSLAWFAVDKQHMKNMLGLTKEFKNNCFKDFNIKEIILDTKYKETAEFVKLLAQAKSEVTIRLYNNIPPWE